MVVGLDSVQNDGSIHPQSFHVACNISVLDLLLLKIRTHRGVHAGDEGDAGDEVLSCGVLVCPVLSCSVQSFPVLSCAVLLCLVLSCLVPCWLLSVLACPVLSCSACPVLSCPVLWCPVLSCPVLFCPVLSCSVLSCPVLFRGSGMCLVWFSEDKRIGLNQNQMF